MNREDIIAMAREAGADFELGEPHGDMVKVLERFAKLVRDDYSNKHANLWLDRCHKFMLDEREACAKLCEELVPDMSRTANDASVWDVATFDCAAAIRARGETK